tara:strand:+ start:1260 stop:2186 length:927 start_codon:yes stop_codon:yes gene_type:complete
MTNYGKKCKTNKDCSSKICEMTYKNRVPDTRRCVDGSKSEKSESVTDTEKELEFGGECQGDSDCSSGLCEPKYGYKEGKDVNLGNFCVNQELKLSTECTYDNECKSGRCKTVYDGDVPVSRKCVIFEAMPKIDNVNRNFGDMKEEDLPEFAQSKEWKAARNETYILSDSEKAKKLQGRGIIADIIIILMELVVLGIKTVFRILFDIWKIIFYVVSFIPSLILKIKFFGFLDKYKCTDSSKCVVGNCDSNKSFTIKAKYLKQLLVILFPPYGVFISKGISSIKEIMLTSILTIMFYFPGMIYGLKVIEE